MGVSLVKVVSLMGVAGSRLCLVSAAKPPDGLTTLGPSSARMHLMALSLNLVIKSSLTLPLDLDSLIKT